MSSLTEALFGSAAPSAKKKLKGKQQPAAAAPDVTAVAPASPSTPPSFEPVQKTKADLFALAPQVKKASRKERQRQRLGLLNGAQDIGKVANALVVEKSVRGVGKGASADADDHDGNPWKTVLLFKAPNPTDDEDGDGGGEGRSGKGRKKPKKLLRHGLERNEEEEGRTVFVGNLPNTIVKKEVGRYFKDCGEIESVRVRNQALADPEDREKAKTRGKAVRVLRGEVKKGDTYSATAYVLFKDAAAVEKALAKNGLVTNGRHLVVTRLDVESSAYPPETSVFLGNLAYSTSEEMVWQFFTDHGISDVRRVRLVRDKETGDCKGFGYVEFLSRGSVSPAIATRGNKLNGREVRIVHVQKSKDVRAAQQTRREKRKRSHSESIPAQGAKRSKAESSVASTKSQSGTKAKDEGSRHSWMGTVTNPRRKMPKELRFLVDGGKREKAKPGVATR